MTSTTELFLTGITDCMVIWVSGTCFFFKPPTGGRISVRYIIKPLLFVCFLAGMVGTAIHGFLAVAALEPRVPFAAGFCLSICLAPAGVWALRALKRRTERNTPSEHAAAGPEKQ